jgi:hypothetical protein
MAVLVARHRLQGVGAQEGEGVATAKVVPEALEVECGLDVAVLPQQGLA